MSEKRKPVGGPGRRLPCVFEGLPPGPIDLASLEMAMARDTERRSLAALDRAVASHQPAAGGGAATPARPRVPKAKPEAG